MPKGRNTTCSNCGAELPSGAEFCGECGEPVSAKHAGSVRRTIEPQATGAMKPIVEHPDHVRTRSEIRKQKRKGAIIGVFLLALAAAVAAGIYFYLANEAATRAETERIVAEHEAEAERAQQQAAEAAAEEAAVQKRDALHNVTFAVSGMDYDQSATRIPLKLTGTTQAGETIDQVVFVGSDGMGVAVPAGKYAATVIESPMASTGMLYTIPTDAMEFTVSEDDGETVSSGQAITLLPIEASKITQQMVDDSYGWAIQDEGFTNHAESCRAAAEKTLSEWTDERRAAEAQKAKAQQRAPLAQQFVSEYFTTVVFNDQDDDSNVSPASNWEEILEPYVKPNSKLAKHIAEGPPSGYSVTLSADPTKSDDKTVTVGANVASSDKAEPGWTLQSSDVTVVCTFDDDNLITGMKVTTSKGTKEY